MMGGCCYSTFGSTARSIVPPGDTHIVAVARSTLGTPWHHQGRLPGVGLDCVGLVLYVAQACDRVPPDLDVRGYGREPDGVTLIGTLDSHADTVGQMAMMPGDVVVVAFDRLPQHVGIVGDYRHGGLSIIHAASHEGRVIETRMLFTQSMRFVAAYRMKEAGAWRN